MAKSKKTKTVKQVYTEQPITLEQLRSACKRNKGNLSVIDTSLMTTFKDLFSVYPLTSWTDADFRGIDSWNTSNVTDMSGTFKGCLYFARTLYNWDVSKVTDMSYMFSSCRAFNGTVVNWDVSNVTNMSHMFEYCYKFTRDLSNWNVSNVEDMSYMFYYCNTLTTLPRLWNTSKVKSMAHIFEGMQNFNFDLSGWDFSSLEDASYMFKGHQRFNQSVANWNMLSLTNTEYMFYDCNAMTYFDVSNWDMSNVKSMSYMFYRCYNARFSDISGWNVSNVRNMSAAFYSCTYFESDLSNWDVSKVEDISSAFNGCRYLNFDISGWNVSFVKDMSNVFRSCLALSSNASNWKIYDADCSNFNNNTTGIIADWYDTSTNNISEDRKYINVLRNEIKANKGNLQNVDISNLRRLSNLFKDTELQAWDTADFNGIEQWDVSFCLDLSYMFYKCINFNTNIVNWNVSNVEDMRYMFYMCSSFNQPLNGWNVSNVTNIRYMFFNCNSFNQPLDQWNVSKVTDMDYAFYKATSFDQNIDNWDVSNVVSVNDTRNIFTDCPTQPSWYGDVRPTNWTELNNYVHEKGGTHPSGYKYYGRMHKIKTDLITDFSRIFYSMKEDNEFFKGIETWDVSNGVTFSQMFYGCTNFNQDISGWNMKSADNCNSMFYECSNFNQDLPDWDVRQLTDAGAMFYRCYKFNGRLDNWSTDVLTNMSSMFNSCYVFNQSVNHFKTNYLNSISSAFDSCYEFNQPLDNWDVSKVKYASNVFTRCKKFNQNINNWVFDPSITSLSSFFSECYEFNQPLDNWDVSNITNMNGTFSHCYAFNQDISMWNVSNVTNMSYMFQECHSFNQPLDKWNVSKVNNTYYMFRNATSWFHSLDNWNVSSNMTYDVFVNTKKNVKAIWNDNNYYPEDIDTLATDVTLCKGNLGRIKTMMITDMNTLFSVRVPGAKKWVNSDFNGIGTWDVSSVTNVTGMFKDCTNFNQDISGWNTTSLEVINSFAENCTSFDQNLDGWYYQNMIDRSASTKAFANCPTSPIWYGVFTPQTKDELIALVADKSIGLNKIDTKFITDMANIFQGSDRTDAEFNGIETWNVSKVTTLDYMFDGAVNFNKDISGWSVNNVTSAEGTFRDCINYNQQLNTWNTGNFVNTSLMLQGCQSYNQPMDAWNTSKLENISNMFNGCISLNQDFDMWDVRTVTDMTNTFEQVTQQPWWYGLIFEEDIVLNTPTDIDFSTLYPLTNGKQLNITSNSTDLSIVNQYGNTFQFTSNVLGNYVPLVECNGGMINIKVNIINPDVNYSTDVKAQYFKVLDFTQLYPSINITSLVISNESAGLTVENVQNYEYRFKADAEGVYTADISVNNVYNGTLTFNSSKLIQDFTINSKTDEVTRKDFNTEYTGYDVTTMTIVSNDANLEVTKISDGIFEFRPLSDGTFTATIELLGLTSTATVISDKVLSDITDNGTATIKQEIDIRNFITNIDFSKMTITSSDANFKVRKVSDIIYELLALVSGTFTAEIRLENETSTLTYTADKLLSDETRELSSNRIYDFDFNRLFPNSVLNSVTITSPNPDLIITETSKNVFILEAQVAGTINAIISINGDETRLVLKISKYIKDETFIVYNRFFNINFATKYPGLNTKELRVTPSIPNNNLKITKVSDDKYTFTFYKKGTYTVDIQLGKVISTYTFKVFFVDSSKIDIYQYPETFISDLIKPELYDPNLYIYQYNQYGEIEWVNKLFNYINDKISKTINYIYLWYVLKTNQNLNDLDMSFITDNNAYYYLNFLERNFDSIYKSFGNPGAIIFWDTPPSQWNDNRTRWDETVKTSDMSINKFKSILRFIKDISNKSFNINRFVQFCYEFINCDKDKADPINNVYVDESSFDTPEDVIVYVDVIDENTNLLTTVLRSAYKHIMPMYNFSVKEKIVP